MRRLESWEVVEYLETEGHQEVQVDNVTAEYVVGTAEVNGERVRFRASRILQLSSFPEVKIMALSS